MRQQPVAQDDFAAAINPTIRPTQPWRVRTVAALPDYRLLVRFNDGLMGSVAMAGLIESPSAGVFAALRDQTLFSQAAILHGAVTWPNGLDLAPDAMYAAIKASGEWRLD